MSYCKIVISNGIKVSLMFANKKDADEATEENLQVQAREFVEYALSKMKQSKSLPEK